MRHLLDVSGDEAEAIRLAEHLTDADPDRWVNESVAGEEYGDHVRSRRDATRASSAGGRRRADAVPPPA
jgi:hypothetical protein